jgi:hypothetical protein
VKDINGVESISAEDRSHYALLSPVYLFPKIGKSILDREMNFGSRSVSDRYIIQDEKQLVSLLV